MKSIPCDKDHAVHAVHGECTLHMGHMHTTVKNGMMFAWPQHQLTVGKKHS